MTINTGNVVVPITPNSPKVQIANGHVVGVAIMKQDTPIGQLITLQVGEAAGVAGPFYSAVGDATAFSDNNDMNLALADLLIASGFDANFMPPDKGTYAKTWLASQTYTSALKTLKPALQALLVKLNSDLTQGYPATSGTTPQPSAGTPLDIVDLLEKWLASYVTLHAASNGTISATAADVV